jgi:hypothetical protein
MLLGGLGPILTKNDEMNQLEPESDQDALFRLYDKMDQHQHDALQRLYDEVGLLKSRLACVQTDNDHLQSSLKQQREMYDRRIQRRDEALEETSHRSKTLANYLEQLGYATRCARALSPKSVSATPTSPKSYAPSAPPCVKHAEVRASYDEPTENRRDRDPHRNHTGRL